MIDLRVCYNISGEAWKHFDQLHPEFAVEPHNIRLGLCSNGFNPYIQASTKPYSC